MTMDHLTKRIAIGIAVAHTLLLAAYTMPSQVVPVRMRYWSQAYARVLFHQDWRLFAPDPPACGCSIDISGESGEPVERLQDLHGGFIWKRMAANACRYAEASGTDSLGRVRMYGSMERSLVDMTGHNPLFDGSVLSLHRSCADSVEEREEIRFTQTPR